MDIVVNGESWNADYVAGKELHVFVWHEASRRYGIESSKELELTPKEQRNIAYLMDVWARCAAAIGRAIDPEIKEQTPEEPAPINQRPRRHRRGNLSTTNEQDGE